MDKQIIIEAQEYPIKAGESWWIVHPNYSKCEFKAPAGAIAFCMKNLKSYFKKGTIYTILENDEGHGYISLSAGADKIKMPYYVFARYFDSEAFIRGRFEVNPEKAKPFDYRPTVPQPPGPKQLELFKDKN